MKLFLSKKGFVTLSALALMVLSFPFAASLVMRHMAAPVIYDAVSEAPTKETVLVLGAAAYPSRLSDVLKDRMDTAIEYYLAGKAQKILLSGAPNEVEGMVKYAQKRNIESDDLLSDSEGLSTMESIRRAADQHKNLAIVTQQFHLPRALFFARHFGIDAVGVVADRHEYIKIFEFRERELLASTKAVWDIFFLNKLYDL